MNFLVKMHCEELHQLAPIDRTSGTIGEECVRWRFGGIFHSHVKHMEGFNPMYIYYWIFTCGRYEHLSSRKLLIIHLF